ncbi:MAG: zinc metallopeptidase [Dysgonamonadaceae bacterium]|jgi:predicted metalloprotease|nr:zinc metallopeptidase [Dysgonamonadaceae bacterium]
MEWQNARRSSNVEDRRGQGGLGGFGGFGGGSNLFGGKGCGCGGGLGLIVVIILFWVMGENPLQLIGMMDGGNQVADSGYTNDGSPAQDDREGQFASAVLANTEDVWTELFRQMRRSYTPPTLVLYNQYTTSGCGGAQSSTGPFYCPNDEKVYLDLSFFQQMTQQFRAGGDFADAYVIAHEVGHHVQKLLGTLDQVNSQMARSSQKDANALSVRLELQADFYAGVWAHYAKELKINNEDINEALNAASAIGDDRLQKESQGYTVPDSFTHGTSQQRHDWFYKGYTTGDMNQGNTFAGI